MSTRLSIIVPFYDETAFLPMALRSIAAQGIEGVEVIVVNDNPDRFGPDVFDAMALPPGVQVVAHDRNRGLSAARNTGMAVARGARIGFLDADDYFLADGLGAQLRLAEETGADLTHASCCISHVGSPEIRLLPRDGLLFPERTTGRGLAGLEAAQFITSSWSSLYRADFLRRDGLSFDVEQVKFEDRLFVLQTVTAARSIAVLGQPVRVWRRRAGSISVTPPDALIHRLQLQLLEKCMAHMRAHAAGPGVPPRFLRRELFNTLSRLIWDVGLLQAVNAGEPGLDGFADRIRALVDGDPFGQAIFDDPVLAHVSRVGQKTRRGIIRRVDVFAVHKALREGDIPAAAAILAERAPQPVVRNAGPAAAWRPRGGASLPRIVLHLGLHKTGSTALQRSLADGRQALAREGILFAQSGLAGPDYAPPRPDGFPGHLGLAAALRRRQEQVFQALRQEVRDAAPRLLLLSAENLVFPLEEDRDALIARLFDLLPAAGRIDIVALVRRPDVWPEMFWRELVCNGQRLGARSLAEFLNDHAARLTDLPALFVPFEAATGQAVRLVDYDAAQSAGQGGTLAAFARAADLPAAAVAALPPPPRVYPTPDRNHVEAARLIASMLAQAEMRATVTRAFFAAGPQGQGDQRSALPPAVRIDLLQRFRAASAEFAAARGYAPALDAMEAALGAEDWVPAGALPADLVERLHHARLQAERLLPPQAAPVALAAAPVADLPPPLAAAADAPGAPATPGVQDQPIPPRRSAPPERSPRAEVTLRLRLRPWARRLLRLD